MKCPPLSGCLPQTQMAPDPGLVCAVDTSQVLPMPHVREELVGRGPGTLRALGAEVESLDPPSHLKYNQSKQVSPHRE